MRTVALLAAASLIALAACTSPAAPDPASIGSTLDPDGYRAQAGPTGGLGTAPAHRGAIGPSLDPNG